MLKKFAFTALAFVAVAGIQGQAEEAIAIGPYVQHVTDESAVVSWATIENETTLITPDGEKSIREYRHHEVMLPNLKPDTEYRHNVGGKMNPAQEVVFRTMPEGIVPFRFVAFGDTRSRHDVHQRLVNMIIKEEPRMVFNTGDLVSDGDEISHWEDFFRVSGELMRHTPYYPMLGNHEHNSPHYFNFFSLPGNERYYTLTVGDVLFLVLDDQGMNYPKPAYLAEETEDYFWQNYLMDYRLKQKAWVEHMLKMHKDAGYVFVMFHEPLISVKRTRVEDAKVRRAFWGDLFERNGVQAVINGHDHHYHRAQVGNTQYITTGGGGASLYDPDTPAPETKKISKIEHYLRVDVGLEEAVITAVDINDGIIEAITLPRR
jgi:acid phosphatase type 7